MNMRDMHIHRDPDEILRISTKDALHVQVQGLNAAIRITPTGHLESRTPDGWELCTCEEAARVLEGMEVPFAVGFARLLARLTEKEDT